MTKAEFLEKYDLVSEDDDDGEWVVCVQDIFVLTASDRLDEVLAQMRARADDLNEMLSDLETVTDWEEK